MGQPIILASDHRGVELKRALRERLERAGREVLDLGTHGSESVDYPAFAATPWSFIKVADNIEGGLPHTRDDFIVLSEDVSKGLFDMRARQTPETALLRGGMLLSYGMHKEAGEVFARLIDKGATPPVRDRAWFYQWLRVDEVAG